MLSGAGSEPVPPLRPGGVFEKEYPLKLTFRFATAAMGVLLVGGAVALRPLLAGDDWKKTFQGKYESKNSWEKAAALKTLDPTNADQLKFLFKLAESEDWYMRTTIADVLAAKPEGKTLDDMKKVLKAGKPVLTAEVIATALGRTKDTAFVPELIDGLKNKSNDYHVKRACAIALGILPAKKGVSALIEALDKEAKNFLVQVHCLEALANATQEKDKRTVADWKNWWSGAETNWEPPSGDKKDDKEKDPDRVRTTVRGTDLDFRSRGKGRPLLVLPEYGYEEDYFVTYLKNLEETNQIIYMKLPEIDSYKNPPLPNRAGATPAMPDYPIERLADTLEDLRTQMIKDKKLEDKPYAILGHGMTAWVAMKFASKYPKGVSRLILVAATPSGKAWGRDNDAMEKEGQKTGDQELEHAAQSHINIGGKNKYEASAGDDRNALERKEFTSYFGDWQDLEIGRIFGPLVVKPPIQEPRGKVLRYMGGCYIPDFDLNKEADITVNTLIIGGEKAFFGTPADTDEISKHCTKAKATAIRGASMPFFEENKKFVEAMEKFLH
jgi:pimeloyl-ACP methyl ester carboxylesterase